MTISPGSTRSCPACDARIFSEMVIPIGYPSPTF
jgi:hypothetical protein